MIGAVESLYVNKPYIKFEIFAKNSFKLYSKIGIDAVWHIIVFVRVFEFIGAKFRLVAVIARPGRFRYWMRSTIVS